MKKFGLIGHPIAHSLSPALFKAAYDGKYAYDLIEGEDFEASYRRFAEEYDAINVTAPFKEPAFFKADILSEECKATGATNLLVKTPEGIKAYNSDFLGVRMWLSEAAEDLKGVLPPWPQGSRAVSKQPSGLLRRAATKWEGLFRHPWSQMDCAGTIELPLSPDYDERPRQKVDFKQGKAAHTEYEIVEVNPDETADLLLYPHTGRTHQLRVHCAHALGLGRPILGDLLYGGYSIYTSLETAYGSASSEAHHPTRLCLHALSITFIHPQTGTPLTFTSRELCY